MTISTDGRSIESIGHSSGSNYHNNLDCSVTVNVNVLLVEEAFRLEGHSSCYFDWVLVNGQKYCYNSGPDGLTVSARSRIRFRTDYSVTYSGFKIRALPFCTHVDGGQPNGEDCMCGTNECTLTTGQRYCIASTSTCAACQPGKYYTSSRSCSSCPRGKYQGDYSSSYSCKQCTRGKYSANTHATACKSCPSGWYGNENSRSYCSGCPAGWWSNALWATYCRKCLAGKYSTEVAATSASVCTHCPKGMWSETVAANTLSHCRQCSAGRFSSQLGRSIECHSCGKGKYQDKKGQQNCINCGKGKYNLFYASAREVACLDCPSGRYNDLLGLGRECPVCHISNDQQSGSKDCKGCHPGKYKLIEDKVSECVVCPKGFFAESMNSPQCAKCPKGYIAKDFASVDEDRRRHDECSKCPRGRYGTHRDHNSPTL